MNRKKFLTIFLSTLLITLALSAVAFADTGGKATSVSSWNALQTAVKNAGNGDQILLTGPILNTENKDRIKVDGKSITIDLKGKKVDRKRTSSHADGHVFEVVNGAVLTITDSVGGGVITGGWANNGGAINIDAKSKCIINGSITISGNKAEVDGGGICVKGSLEITGATVTGNTAKDNGGGIYMDAKGQKTTITDTRIEKNTSKDDGAGIFLYRGNIEMTGGSLVSNTTDNDSGGVKITSNTVFHANGVTIKDNTAKSEEGGGVKNQGTTTLKNCTITGNSAKKLGGGVFNDNDGDSKGDMTIESCTISGNRTESNGGGIYSDKKLRMKDSTITGNNASDRGCGIFIGGDSEPTDIEGTIVVQNNVPSNNGQEVYLREGRVLNLTGPLAAGTMIGVTIQDNHGTFTRNYKTYHQNVKPEKFFFSPENLEMDFAGTGADTGEIYLGWASMVWTKDCEFSFENTDSPAFYTGKYDMLDSDFEKMCNYLKKLNCEYCKSDIVKEMNEEWGGSCYGMSASVALDYTGQLAFNENLDPPKKTMYKVLTLEGGDAVEYFRVRRDRVISAVNYYQLAQDIPVTWKKESRYSKEYSTLPNGLRRLVDRSKKGDIIMLGYKHKKKDKIYGHEIIVKGYGGTDSNGDHVLNAYDNRYAGKTKKITIAKDFSKGVLHASKDEEFEKVEIMTDFSEFDKIDFDGPNNDMIIDFGGRGASESLQTMPDTWAEIIVPLDSSSDTISIENENGETLKVSDGDVDKDSSMKVIEENMIMRSTAENDSAVSLALLVEKSDSFTFESTSKDIEASVISDSYYSDVSTENADSVKITEGETFVFGDEVNYNVSHSIESDQCDMVSIGGTTKGDSSISFIDDVIDLKGYDGGFIYMTIYVDGEGFQTVPVDINAFLEGIKVEDIIKDPCQYGHMLALRETVPATFDADGHTEYWYCDKCHRAYLFDDWHRETEIALADTVIKKIKTTSLNKSTFQYNGSVQKPALIIKDSDGKTIDPQFYTADFSNAKSKNAGSYKVKVTFKGNYEGTKDLTYTIRKAANPMKVKAKKPAAKASQDTKISRASAFKISEAKGKLKFRKVSGNSKITVASSGNVTVKKGLAKGQTYSVKVKVTAKGNKNYKAGSKTVTLKIRIK